MNTAFAIMSFVLGSCIGSFINAATYRLKRGKPIANDRSKCVHCERVLEAIDLVPVLSFLFLKGKCRTCVKTIPKRYVAVELAGAFLFLLVFLRFPSPLLWGSRELLGLIRDFFAVSVLLFLFVYDYLYSLLPDEVTLPAIALFAASSWLLGMPWPQLLIGIAVGGGFFLLQYVVSSGRWIGGGDIRFGAMMGALLGWPMVLVGLFISYVAGASVAVVLLVKKQKRFGQHIPFGTFLAAGTLAAMWFGQDLLNWYLGFL